MKFTIATTVLPFFLAHQVLAICPGFNFGIGNVQHLSDGRNRWNVYDARCNVVDGLITQKNGNPCTQGNIFGCSPPPIIFNRYKNNRNGITYKCRRDPNSGKCGNNVISVCCRNDGN